MTHKELARGVSRLENVSRGYVSYLVRIWREDEGATTWRASIVGSLSGRRVGFASLEDLCTFLKQHSAADIGMPESPVSDQMTKEENE